MAKYNCRYVSDGITHTCFVEASSSSEASARMRGLRWAPGCGPVGNPTRNGGVSAATATAMSAFAAAVLGTLAVMFAQPDNDIQQTAALADLARQ